MISIEELLGIKKPVIKESAITEKVEEPGVDKEPAVKRKLFIKPAIPAPEAPEAPEAPATPATPTATPKSAKLALALKTAKQQLSIQQAAAKKLAQQETAISETPLQQATDPSTAPTMQDVSKFVFNEQDKEFDEDITETFSTSLNELQNATGTDVPANLAKCLLFIKENDFLIDMLKPEHAVILVRGMHKSYGFIVQSKAIKSQKKNTASKKVDKLLDTMSGMDF